MGLAKKFKKRFTKHRATLQSRTADGQTTMSNYDWEQKDKNMDPKVSWKILQISDCPESECGIAQPPYRNIFSMQAQTHLFNW